MYMEVIISGLYSKVAIVLTFNDFYQLCAKEVPSSKSGFGGLPGCQCHLITKHCLGLSADEL